MITLTNVYKNYGIEPILQGFSMTINFGERVGLIGINGSGKSTICKLISGQEVADQGDVAIGRNMRIGYLAQIPVRDGDERVQDRLKKGVSHLHHLEEKMQRLELLMADGKNLKSEELEKYVTEYGRVCAEFEQLGGYSYESRINLILQGLGFTLPRDTFVKDLSGGELARLELAVLLLGEPDILLLDEPTNHLDFSAIYWLETFIKQYKRTVIIISHDRYFLDQTVQRIIEVKNGQSEEYSGNYSYYLQEREIRFQIALKEYENQQKEIRRKEEAIKRIRHWAHIGDNEKLFKQAASMEKQLEKMVKVDSPEMNDPKYQLQFAGDRSGRDVLLLKDIRKVFDENCVLDSVDLHFRYGQRVGLVGPNGSGKSTLLKLIIGQSSPDQGEIKRGTNLKIGYFDQHQELTEVEETILEGFRLAAPPMSESVARAILARFGFVGDEVFKRIKDLSGGERSRFILLKMVYSQVNFMILDEPTNHLDLQSIEILEEALMDFEGTLLVVSHDRYFLKKVVDEIYAIENGQLVYYPGNYEYYQMKLEEKEKVEFREEQNGKKMKAKGSLTSAQNDEKKQIKREKELKNELTRLEERITLLEGALEVKHQLMVNPDNIMDYQYLNKLKMEIDKLEEELKEALERWEEVCLILES